MNGNDSVIIGDMTSRTVFARVQVILLSKNNIFLYKKTFSIARFRFYGLHAKASASKSEENVKGNQRIVKFVE